MSMHTPGPWVARDHYIGPATDSGAPNVGFALYRVNSTEGQVSANARLMAAAPELLAALADMIEAADSMRNTYGRIDGRHPEEDDTYIHEKWAESFLQERADAARSAISKATGGAK